MLLILATLLFALYAIASVGITAAAMVWLLNNLGAPPLIVTYPIIGDIAYGAIMLACFAFLGWVFVTQPPRH